MWLTAYFCTVIASTIHVIEIPPTVQVSSKNFNFQTMVSMERELILRRLSHMGIIWKNAI